MIWPPFLGILPTGFKKNINKVLRHLVFIKELLHLEVCTSFSSES